MSDQGTKRPASAMKLRSAQRGLWADSALGVTEKLMRALGRRVRRLFFPTRVRQPLFRGPLSDDLLFGQPVNTILRLVHYWGNRQSVAADGVSVVVVNWNTLDRLKISIAAVQRFSPPSTEIIVVDNASTDGSREWLKNRPFGARVALLPVNIGHGRGLDVGVAFSRRPIVVTLDSDAFPYTGQWLPVLLKPIQEEGMLACGMWGRRDRLHPACAAFTRKSYFTSNLSLMGYIPYVDRGEPFELGLNAWDTAEVFFNSLGPDQTRILPADPTDFGGCTMAGAVYHHYASTTLRMSETTDGLAWARSSPDHLESEERSWATAVASLLS